MKSLVQRVTSASVQVDGEIVGAIDQGILVFVGVERGDTGATVSRMAQRLLTYRLFGDADDRMNLSVRDVAGGVLLVSQFTLAADTRKGTRPSFSRAGSPEEAERLFNALVDEMRSLHNPVATGRFAADMKVSLLNDGPVTFMLEA